jgi:ankyrin repeat protein
MSIARLGMLVNVRVRVAATLLGCLLTTGCAPPLVDCVRDGDVSRTRRLLDAGVHPDRASRGTTALMYASDSGDTSMLKLLLDHGASVDLKNADDADMTALMYAAWGCHRRAVELLLDQGADCRPRRIGYYLGDSTRVFETGFGDNALTLSVRRGCLPVVEALLEAGADPNAIVVREDVTLMEGWHMEWRRMLTSDARLASAYGRRHLAFTDDLAPVPLASVLDVAGENDELVAVLKRFGASSTPHVLMGGGVSSGMPPN